MSVPRPARASLGLIAVLLGVLQLLTAACNAGLNAKQAAALTTAVAVGVSTVRRASGDCFTWCAPGTRCNEATGLCDPLPCWGNCKADEICDASGAVPKCIPAPNQDMEIRNTPAAKPPDLLKDENTP